MFAVRCTSPMGSLQPSLELGEIVQVESDGGIDVASVPIFTGKVVLIGYRTNDDNLGLELGAELLQLVEIGNLRLGELNHGSGIPFSVRWRLHAPAGRRSASARSR